jgi:hypothetical protein
VTTRSSAARGEDYPRITRPRAGLLIAALLAYLVAGIASVVAMLFWL